MNITLVVNDPMIETTVRAMLADPRLNIVFKTDPSRLSKGARAQYREILVAEVCEAHGYAVEAFQTAQRRGIPIVAISRKPEEARALGIAEDDILQAPFTRVELLERIARIDIARGSVAQVRVGDLTLDRSANAAFVGETRLVLTPREMDVLDALMTRAGRTVTKDKLMDALYGTADGPEMKIIDVFVCKVRTKIKALTGGDPLIETVWGRGYKLEGPVAHGAHIPKLTRARAAGASPAELACPA